MKHLTLSDVYFNPNEATALATAALRTDGTLVEWTSEKNTVYAPAAANGSRIIISPSSGSLAGKQMRDNATGAPFNTVQYIPRARMRNRVCAGVDPNGIYGMVGDEIPILNAGFTMMRVCDNKSALLFGYDTAGGNSPFGLRVVSELNRQYFQLGYGGNYQSIDFDYNSQYQRARCWVISCTENGQLMIAMEDKYEVRKFDFPHDFGSNNHADFGANNDPKAIQFGYANVGQQDGYFRVADVAYTEAQLIAWRDFLCQYWLGRVPSP